MIRPSRPTLAAFDAMKAQVERMRPFMTGMMPEDQSARLEALLVEHLEATRALRVMVRGDRASARELERADMATRAAR